MADTAGINFELQEVRLLARNLKAASPAAYSAMRRAMKGAMAPVAADAAKRASWSDRIPGTVTFGSRGAVGYVKAGGSKAPDAAPFEHRGVQGSFRHPVFARGDRATWTWVNQTARPFLHPAGDAMAPQVAVTLTHAVTDAVMDVVSEGLR